MKNVDPYSVLLAIATNIPQLLKTGFVLQGHFFIFFCVVHCWVPVAGYSFVPLMLLRYILISVILLCNFISSWATSGFTLSVKSTKIQNIKIQK